jgi:predicted ATPase
MLEAIAVGRDALRLLGIDLPSEPDKALIGKALQALAGQLQDKHIEQLVDLPVMTNPQTRAAMQLLGMLLPPIFQGMPSLTPLVSCTMVSLSLHCGNAPASTMGYGIHGMVLCAFLGEPKTGYDFGKLALSLVDRFNAPEFKSIILLQFGSFIQHHQESLLATLPTLKDGYTAGMETGNFLRWGRTRHLGNRDSKLQRSVGSGEAIFCPDLFGYDEADSAQLEGNSKSTGLLNWNCL